jgi:protocatechuate 3,4-dioxygenase beta subunit
MPPSRVAILLAALVPAAAAVAAAAADPPAARVPVVGLPCENCDVVFEGMPAEIAPAARIAPAEQPGEPLRIEGAVTYPDGSPAPGTIVYAYHTDAGGIYPRAATRHGALRGWARAGSDGRYAFRTIRPGGYPGTDIPQHVHLHVIEPGRCTYWIDDVVFRDDPRLTERQIRFHDGGRGGSGIVTPTRDPDGTWVAVRDIRLGAGIDGWPPLAAPAGAE